ncbi:MAG: nucleotidyltransferase domain-containing protein [Syntrophorhabdales bacterium]|jgi:predicted nucleotidyltransferase
MIYEEGLRRLAEMLCEAASPTRIILFGSWARVQSNNHTDIDVMVVEHDVKDRGVEMVRPGRVISPLRMPVDLLVVDEEGFKYLVGGTGQRVLRGTRERNSPV